VSAPAYQLRTYKLHEGMLEEFIAEWRAHVVPLRRKLGFEVIGAWADREQETFVWMLSYDGPDGFAAREGEYYTSPERAALDPDPARHIASAETRMLTAVDLDG
jgi:hypothetical protein